MLLYTEVLHLNIASTTESLKDKSTWMLPVCKQHRLSRNRNREQMHSAVIQFRFCLDGSSEHPPDIKFSLLFPPGARLTRITPSMQNTEDGHVLPSCRSSPDVPHVNSWSFLLLHLSSCSQPSHRIGGEWLLLLFIFWKNDTVKIS